MRIDGIEQTPTHIEIKPYHIARGLGRIVRFAGHTEEPCTVLQHVLAGAIFANNKWNDGGRAALLFLLHDAPEAISGEIPKGFKTDEQKRQEGMILLALHDSWGIELADDEEQRAIGWLDNAIADDEIAEYKLEGCSRDSGDMMLRRIVRAVKGINTFNNKELWSIYHEAVTTKDMRLLDLIGVK